MPDGIVPQTETSALEVAADTADSRLVRHVRRNLVLWSGGTTLIILLILAVALYVAVAGSLANRSIQQLDARFGEVSSSLTGQRPDPDDSGPYGFIFGGGGSGTVALAVDENDRVLAPRGFHIPPGLPDMDAVTAARATGRDIRTESLTSQGPGPGGSAATDVTPVRILTENVALTGGPIYTVQVVGDRIAEERTLQVMLVVLLVGGLVVVLVAFGFGTLYARRALVPIRESLTNQRAALRRQREFAADASHELRTPLTVIRSSVEHLERHRDEPVAKVGSALEDIDDEVRHMTAIVEDLLLLARSDSGAVALEHVPVDLGDVAADGASAMGKPATDRGVRVEVDPQPAVVAGDPARLRQLVMILVDNAIRHSPTDGRVGVAVRAEHAGASLVVEDDGPGIRPEDLPHVFERFYRAPGAPGGGTGLGLAIAAWIVDRHGGRIEVANRAEGGARFVVSLPATGGVPG
jgi:signal transduction histidine kinase